MVEATATTEPGSAPRNTPSLPNRAASTSESNPTTTMVRSLIEAAALGESAAVTPIFTAAARESSRKSKPTTSNPAAIMWRAIGRPILPSPISPTVRMVLAISASVIRVGGRFAAA